jgi:hypothetical protein
MSAAAGKTYNFAFSENDMVGYYDHNGAMVRDGEDRSIFRIAGFENISWPRGGSGSTVTWTKVRLSCAIYSFDPSRGSYRQDHDLTSQIKFTDKLLCGDGEQLMFAKLHWRKHGPQSSATNFGSSVREVSSMSEPGQKWVRNKTDDRLQDEQTVLVDQFANPVASTCMESLPMFLGKTGSGRVGSATKRDFPASYPTGSWNTDSKVVSDPGNSTTVTFHSSVPVPVLAPGVVYKLDDKAELPSWWLKYWRNWTDEQASSAKPIELLDLERDTGVITDWPIERPHVNVGIDGYEATCAYDVRERTLLVMRIAKQRLPGTEGGQWHNYTRVGIRLDEPQDLLTVPQELTQYQPMSMEYIADSIKFNSKVGLDLELLRSGGNAAGDLAPITGQDWGAQYTFPQNKENNVMKQLSNGEFGRYPRGQWTPLGEFTPWDYAKDAVLQDGQMRLYFEQPAGATGYLVLPQLKSGFLVFKQAIGASYEIVATTTTVHSQSPYDASVLYPTATEAQVAAQTVMFATDAQAPVRSKLKGGGAEGTVQQSARFIAANGMRGLDHVVVKAENGSEATYRVVNNEAQDGHVELEPAEALSVGSWGNAAAVSIAPAREKEAFVLLDPTTLAAKKTTVTTYYSPQQRSLKTDLLPRSAYFTFGYPGTFHTVAFGMTILRGDVVFRTHTFNLTYGGALQTCQWRALYEIVGSQTNNGTITHAETGNSWSQNVTTNVPGNGIAATARKDVAVTVSARLIAGSMYAPTVSGVDPKQAGSTTRAELLQSICGAANSQAYTGGSWRADQLGADFIHTADGSSGNDMTCKKVDGLNWRVYSSENFSAGEVDASLLEADGLFNTARNVKSPYLPADFRDPFQYDAEPLGLEVPYDQYAAGQLQESFAWDPTLTDTEVKEFHGPSHGRITAPSWLLERNVCKALVGEAEADYAQVADITDNIVAADVIFGGLDADAANTQYTKGPTGKCQLLKVTGSAETPYLPDPLLTVDAEQQQTFELAPSMACRVHVAETTYEFERGDVVSATLLDAYVVQQRPVLTATERAPLNLQGGIEWDCASSVSRNIARDMMRLRVHVESESVESLLYQPV